MRKQDYIEMNLKLSESFERYLFKHPESVYLPKKANLVFTNSQNVGFTQKSLELAKRFKNAGSFPWYQVHHEKGEWLVHKIDLSKVSV